MSTLTVLADGNPVEIKTTAGITAIVSPGDMALDVPDYFKIGPEETLACANELEQDQWELIIKHERFLAWWRVLWLDSPPPAVLRKGTMAQKASAGMALLITRARAEDRRIWIDQPESFMHPLQGQRMMTFIHAITGVK